MVVEILGGYNEHEYNEPLYNDNDARLTLSDSTSATDADILRVFDMSRAEAVSLIENLMKSFNDEPLLDDVMATPDDLFRNAMLGKVESIGLTDALTASFLKALTESLSIAELRTFLYSMGKVDSLILIDSLTKQITDKRLNDSIQINEWFTVKFNPQSDPWS